MVGNRALWIPGALGATFVINCNLALRPQFPHLYVKRNGLHLTLYKDLELMREAIINQQLIITSYNVLPLLRVVLGKSNPCLMRMHCTTKLRFPPPPPLRP